MKCLATKASLQRPYEDQIVTPFQFCVWATSNIPGVLFDYYTVEEHKNEKKNIER